MNNPIKVLTFREKIFWIVSIVIVVLSNLFTNSLDPLTLAAVLIGITSLAFFAKGHILAQILMIIFSILYIIISFRFHYYGEVIIYLVLSLPMSIISLITWCKNPSTSNTSEVAIRKVSAKNLLVLGIICLIITIIFYFVLHRLNTPNLLVSSISIFTSFFSETLTVLRSSYYGLGYAANDLVLIIMWLLASFEDIAYIPVVINFVIFLFYDIYGFYSWKKRENNF